MGVLLDRPYLCPLCHRKVRQLYPLVHYDAKLGHWRPVNACLACCGPSEQEDSTVAGPFRHKAIER
jgi:hypothetical protein